MTGMRSLFVLAMLGAHAAAAADNEAPQVTPELRQRAEDLAGAASTRFTEFLGGEKRVAQNAPPESTGNQAKVDGAFSRVWEWLARSSQTYEDVVIAQLKNNDGWTVIVQRSGDAAPAQTPIPAAPQEEPRPELRGWSGLVEVVRDWLARANRSYRNEVVKPLLEPAEPGAPSELVEQPPAATPAPLAPPAAPSATTDADAAKKTAADEEIKRERALT